VQIVVNQTPFYAESGGQVGDAGWIRGTRARRGHRYAQKAAGVFIHRRGDARARSSRASRPSWRWTTAAARAIRANHSATHLLHEALRRALGDHVAQRGSLNAPTGCGSISAIPRR
jgi:alanyl-tRNA synthetase